MVAPDSAGPVALAVSSEGVLCAFGELAREAALDCSVQACVALTFDDGPVDGTDDLLDLLADKQARPPTPSSAATPQAEVLWNFDPEHWKDRDSAIVQERVLDAAQPGPIILSRQRYRSG